MTQGFSSAPGTEGPLATVPDAGVRKVRRWGFLIALGGFLFGFDTGVVSGALLFIKTEFGLNAFEQGTVVSVLLLGAIAGALGIRRFADRLGRRKVLGLEGLVFLLGTAIAVLSTGYWSLIVARLILGLAVGAASATTPIYLSEIAPKEIRGRLLTLNQLMITVGILIAYLVNLTFAEAGSWRAMFGVGAIPALLMLAASLWLVPESPEWLMVNGRIDKTRKIIASVTNEATADRLIAQRRQRHEEVSTEETDERTRQGWRAILAAQVRPALIVGLGLAALQQFGGINTIIYYAPTIIQQTGLSASNSVFYSIAIGVINLVMAVVAIRLVDRAGRRQLMIYSLLGMTVTLLLLGLSLMSGWSSVLTLVFMVLYIAVYGIGLGPIFWTLIGEIFPGNARATGSSASTAVNWTSNFVVSLVFLSVVNAIGRGQTFWLFAVICVVGLAFVVRFVPETKGRSFEQIDADLRSRFGR